MKKLLFPGFKSKALTFSYDDNTTQDRRLVKIFRKYGIKATFNINTGLFGKPGSLKYQHEILNHSCVDESEIKALYSGFELASHTVNHISLLKEEYTSFEREISDDCKKIGELCGIRATGFAYPYGEYNAETVKQLKSLGIIYARTVNDTHRFDLPADFLEWHPTCHDHDPEINRLTDEFLSDGGKDLKLFYIWGHSYELDKSDTDRWADMEALCEKLSGKNDIWYATNRSICEYITAAKTVGDCCEENSVGIDLFYEENGVKTVFKAK